MGVGVSYPRVYPGFVTPVLYPEFYPVFVPRFWCVSVPLFVCCRYPVFGILCSGITALSVPGYPCVWDYQARDVLSAPRVGGLAITCEGSLLPRF